MKIYIKNQSDKTIDFCAGIDQEFTLSPGDEAPIKLQDSDVIYIDKAQGGSE